MRTSPSRRPVPFKAYLDRLFLDSNLISRVHDHRWCVGQTYRVSAYALLSVVSRP